MRVKIPAIAYIEAEDKIYRTADTEEFKNIFLETTSPAGLLVTKSGDFIMCSTDTAFTTKKGELVQPFTTYLKPKICLGKLPKKGPIKWSTLLLGLFYPRTREIPSIMQKLQGHDAVQVTSEMRSRVILAWLRRESTPFIPIRDIGLRSLISACGFNLTIHGSRLRIHWRRRRYSSVQSTVFLGNDTRHLEVVARKGDLSITTQGFTFR